MFTSDNFWIRLCIFLSADSLQHLLDCVAFTLLRLGLDAELVRQDRAKYLRKVIQKREELEKELTHRYLIYCDTLYLL